MYTQHFFYLSLISVVRKYSLGLKKIFELAGDFFFLKRKDRGTN
jgi:hypothetical protein